MEDKLITLATENFSRAQILKARLESEGIKCVLTNLNLLQSSVSSGVQVKVAETDMKKAVRIYVKVKGAFLRSGKKRIPRSRSLRKILVPVDFSESSFKTACYALHIAQAYKAHVNFLHVFYLPAVDMVTAPEVNFSQFSLEVILQELKTKANKQMKDFMKKIDVYIGENMLIDVKLKFKVVEGIIEDMILSESKKYKTNYIIMGTLDEDKQANSILGNNAWSIVQKSETPVMVVPDSFEWKGKKKTYNVMFTSDLDDTVFVAVRKLLSILRPFTNVKLHCIHATNRAVNEYQKAKMSELKDYISSVSNANFSVNIIETKDYIKAFNDYVIENKIDLMCMSTRKRGIIERFFSPSLAKKMLYHSYAPLLIVKL